MLNKVGAKTDPCAWESIILNPPSTDPIANVDTEHPVFQQELNSVSHPRRSDRPKVTITICKNGVRNTNRLLILVVI